MAAAPGRCNLAVPRRLRRRGKVTAQGIRACTWRGAGLCLAALVAGNYPAMPPEPQTPALLRRVEEAALNTWPAPRQVLLDGWVLRFADGYTRRANSATPSDPGQDSPGALSRKITACEALYAAQRQPALIRVRSFDAALAAALEARGYVAEGVSPVLWMPLGSTLHASAGPEAVQLSVGKPGPGWLDCQARLSGCDVAARARILDTVAVPCAFAGVPADGPGAPLASAPLASVAFGAVHDGVACLHLVATDPAFRRRGLSRLAVSALLAWARDRLGAQCASLQVAADNTGALALYAGLGFQTELFRYRYYRQPGAAPAGVASNR